MLSNAFQTATVGVAGGRLPKNGDVKLGKLSKKKGGKNKRAPFFKEEEEKTKKEGIKVGVSVLKMKKEEGKDSIFL